MDFLVDELFCFAEEFGGEDADGGCPITNFIILDFGNVYEDLHTLVWRRYFEGTLAAALSNAMDLRIVAPSFVTVISPVEADCRILSWTLKRFS
jgi:hypothetical protein